MAAPAGSFSRDVIFRLRIQSDPADSAALKKFGDDVVKRQKDFDKTKDESSRKSVTREEREAAAILRINQQREAIIANTHLKTQLKIIDERKKREQEFADWKTRLVHKSAVLEHNENIRIARETAAEKKRILAQQEREAAASARRAAQLENRIRLEESRRAASMGRMGRGAMHLGRGLAYSGLVGESNSQRILDTMFAVQATTDVAEGGYDLYRGARGYRGGGRAGSLMGGIGSLLTGGLGIGGRVAGGLGTTATAGGGTAAAAAAGGTGLAALAAPIVAGIAALLGVGAAGVSAVGTYRDVRKYGFMGGAEHGSWRETVAEGANAPFRFASSMLPTWLLQTPGFRVGLGETGTEELIRRQFAGNREASSAAAAFRSEKAAGAADTYGQMSELRFSQIGNNLGTAQSQLRGAVADYGRFAADTDMGAAKELAAKRIKDLESEVLRIHRDQRSTAIDTARERLTAGREELQNAREVARERSRTAADARGDYRTDLQKFAALNPAEQVALKRVKSKTAAGASLTAAEAELAGNFNEFQGAAEESNIGRARAAGADYLFEGGRMRADKAAAESATAAAALAKAELSVKQKIEVVMKLEKDKTFEQALDAQLAKVKAEIMAEQNRELGNMEDRFKHQQRQILTNRRVTQ